MATRNSFIAKKIIMNNFKSSTENPIDHIKIYQPEHNIFEQYFLVYGLTGDYDGGEYLCKITYYEDYPNSSPRIETLTPGRFDKNVGYCLPSFNSFVYNPYQHAFIPNPNTIRRPTIDVVLKSFLDSFKSEEDVPFTIQTNSENKRQLAKKSKEWNEKYRMKNDIDDWQFV